jgi:hypothetical protein
MMGNCSNKVNGCEWEQLLELVCYCLVESPNGLRGNLFTFSSFIDAEDVKFVFKKKDLCRRQNTYIVFSGIGFFVLLAT